MLQGAIPTRGSEQKRSAHCMVLHSAGCCTVLHGVLHAAWCCTLHGVARCMLLHSAVHHAARYTVLQTMGIHTPYGSAP